VWKDPEYQRAALKNFLAELPGLLKEMNEDPATAEVIEGLISAGLLNGAAEGAEKRL